MDTYAEYEFQVRSYECGADGAARLATVCNYLQEAASLNAESLGFSRSDFASEGANISWVLTRMRVAMNRYPRWEEKVVVGTWPRGGRRITAHRDFLLKVGDEVRAASVEVEPGVWAAHVAAPDGHDHVVAQFLIGRRA